MWNEPPDAYATIAYVATELLFYAVEKAGSFDAEEIGKVLKESKDLTSVKGDVYFREAHQMVGKDLAYFVRGKAPSEKQNEWDLFTVEGYFGGEQPLPTLVSALILGQVISLGGTLWSPLAFVAPFIVMFFVILIKPTGLYGVRGIAFGFET